MKISSRTFVSSEISNIFIFFTPRSSNISEPNDNAFGYYIIKNDIRLNKGNILIKNMTCYTVFMLPFQGVSCV